MIKSGDRVVLIETADGEQVAVKVISPILDGDHCVLAQTADGESVAVRLQAGALDGQRGTLGETADGESVLAVPAIALEPQRIQDNAWLSLGSTAPSNIYGPDTSGYLTAWADTWGTYANWCNVDVSSPNIVAVAGDRGSSGGNDASVWVFQRDPTASDPPTLQWYYDTGDETWCTCIKDGFVYAGGDRNSATIWKLTDAGVLEWSYDTGGTSQVREICVDDDGFVYAISTAGTNDHNLWKLDSDGVLQWSLELPYGAPNGLAITSDGYLFVITDSVANENIYCYDWDGQLQSSETLGTYPFAIDISPDDRIYLAGARDSGESVWELDPDDLRISAALHDGDTGEDATAISVATDGTVYIAGNLAAEARAWKFDADLSYHEWALRLDYQTRHIQVPRERSSAVDDTEWDLACSGLTSPINRNFTYGGQALLTNTGTGDEARDIAVAPSGGKYAWVRTNSVFVRNEDGTADTTFNSTGQRNCGGIVRGCCIDASGNVYVVGDASLDEPGETTDTYNVMKFSANGTWLWGTELAAGEGLELYGCVTDGSSLFITGDRQYASNRYSVWKLSCSTGIVQDGYDTGYDTIRCVHDGTYLYVAGRRNQNIDSTYRNVWCLTLAGLSLSWAADTGASYTQDIGVGTNYVFACGRGTSSGGTVYDVWRFDIADGANISYYQAIGNTSSSPNCIAVDSNDRVFVHVYDGSHGLRSINSAGTTLWEADYQPTGIDLR